MYLCFIFYNVILVHFLIKTSFPAWFFIFCLAAGLAYAVLLYYKSSFTIEKRFFSFPNIFLAVLRFLSVSLICYFLLSPFINNLFEKKEKPIIVIAVDNSKSIALSSDSVFYKTKFPSEIDRLSKALSRKYEIQVYRFGKETEKSANLDFSGSRTNISGMMENISEQNFNRNIGAFILASDGIYNEGKEPLEASAGFRSVIYTIALGDTVARKDVFIKEINNNSIAYQGNNFTVRIKAGAIKYKNSKIKLQLIQNGKLIQEKTIEADQDHYIASVDFSVEAKNKGLQKYLVKAVYLDGENNYSNNSREFYVEVLESRKKILILALSPHPDIFAIKNAIEKNDNYRVTSALIGDYRKSEAELEKILSTYDLLVLHQLPGNNNPAREVFLAADKIKIPVFVIIGSQTAIAQFNASNLGLTIMQKKAGLNNTLPILSDNFDYFSFSDKLKSIIPEYPPVISPFADYKINREGQVALFQKIGKINSGFPLLLFLNNVDYRVAVLCGEGIWRWPLTESSLKMEQGAFDELINKTVQYLTVKSDKRFFRLKNLKPLIYEDEPLTFEAEAFNQAYQKMQNAKISMQIRNPENKTFDFTFRETDNDYQLNAGFFPPGKYQFLAATNLNGKDYRIAGDFTVQPVDVEYLNTVADHKLLNVMAKNNYGKMFYPRQTDELIKTLLNQKDIRPVSHLDQDIRDLIEFRWIFAAILLLLCTEWFFRKYFGEY